MSSVSKPRVRHNRHKQGLNLTLEKLSADFRYIDKSTGIFIKELRTYFKLTGYGKDLENKDYPDVWVELVINPDTITIIEDCTDLLINPSFDEDLTFQADGTMKEAISTNTSLSNRSWAYITADSTAYARPKATSGQNRPDGRKMEAVNGFIGRVQGWTVETNQTFPRCEWVYFGTMPYDLANQAVPIADDGPTYLEVPNRPEDIEGENTGFVFLRAGWGNRAVYKQTTNLPCGRYQLEYWTTNINPNATNGRNLTKVVCNESEYRDEASIFGLEWTKHIIGFSANGETSIHLGFESSGSNSTNPFLGAGGNTCV